MKRFMFLFLVVAFVAVMAGGAMATEGCTCPFDTCPPPDYTEDCLELYFDIYGVHWLCIEEESLTFCGIVPCPGSGPYTSPCQDVHFDVKNTGCPGELLVTIGRITETDGFEFISENASGARMWLDNNWQWVRDYPAGVCEGDTLPLALNVYSWAECSETQLNETLCLKIMKK